MSDLSARGAAFLARLEGCILQCYDDGGRPGVGNCTIGVGHLVHMGPTTRGDRQRWGTISTTRAFELLQQDARTAAAAVDRYIAVPLNQAQRDALISFAFNCGGGALSGGVGLSVNAHKDPTAALERWVRAGGKVLPGLVSRRQAEARLFMHSDYADGGKPFLPPRPDLKTVPTKTPVWAWKWVQWRLGRGPFKGHGQDPKWRKRTGAPATVPAWAWTFLRRFGRPSR